MKKLLIVTLLLFTHKANAQSISSGKDSINRATDTVKNKSNIVIIKSQTPKIDTIKPNYSDLIIKKQIPKIDTIRN